MLRGLPDARDRDAEFTASGGSAVEIEARCNELKDQISDAIEALPPAELDRERDHPRRVLLARTRIRLTVVKLEVVAVCDRSIEFATHNFFPELLQEASTPYREQIAISSTPLASHPFGRVT